MQSLEASENWNNCVIWNLENELKWSKRHMLNRNRHGRLRSEKNVVSFLDFRDRNSLWFYFGGKEIQEKHNEKQKQ
jgi:hypothetical protein